MDGGTGGLSSTRLSSWSVWTGTLSPGMLLSAVGAPCCRLWETHHMNMALLVFYLPHRFNRNVSERVEAMEGERDECLMWRQSIVQLH